MLPSKTCRPYMTCIAHMLRVKIAYYMCITHKTYSHSIAHTCFQTSTSVPAQIHACVHNKFIDMYMPIYRQKTSTIPVHATLVIHDIQVMHDMCTMSITYVPFMYYIRACITLWNIRRLHEMQHILL